MSPTITLSNGMAMPLVGLGVFLVSNVVECEASVVTALQAGYRLVDTATLYANERAVGRGIRASGVPRDEIFVTTKLWPSDYSARKAPGAIQACLDRLDVGPIDLLLLHQPFGDVLSAWKAMEDAVDRGDVRAIGVSNFTVADLKTLLPEARIRPVVDQVEFHPYWQQPELLPFLREEGIVPEAWYPLGHGSKELFAEPALTRIAAAHGRSIAQVVLRSQVQAGIVTIPKSTNAAHIVENLDLFDFALTEAEMAEIAALGRKSPMMRVPRWLMSLGTPLLRTRQLA